MKWTLNAIMHAIIVAIFTAGALFEVKLPALGGSVVVIAVLLTVAALFRWLDDDY